MNRGIGNLRVFKRKINNNLIKRRNVSKISRNYRSCFPPPSTPGSYAAIAKDEQNMRLLTEERRREGFVDDPETSFAGGRDAKKVALWTHRDWAALREEKGGGMSSARIFFTSSLKMRRPSSMCTTRKDENSTHASFSMGSIKT